MKYTIIEDCSPYYIRFKWDGLTDVVEYIKEQYKIKQTSPGKLQEFPRYTHYDFDVDTAQTILNQLPMVSDFNFMQNRVGLFITPPYNKTTVHKDGVDHRFSINIPIEVHDKSCTTSWWDDSQFNESNFNYADSYTRQLLMVPVAAKTMVAELNECILFNTDIWHNWNNASTSQRIVLTLRVNNPGALYFDDAKRILFHD